MDAVLIRSSACQAFSKRSEYMERWPKDLPHIENFLNGNLEIRGAFVDSILIEFDVTFASDNDIKASIERCFSILCDF